MVREQLQSSYHILWNDLISATRPVLLSQIIKSVASIKEITDNTVFTSPNLLQNDSTADKQLLVTNISPPSKSGIVTLSKVYKDPEIGDTPCRIAGTNKIKDVPPPPKDSSIFPEIPVLNVIDIHQDAKEVFEMVVQSLEAMNISDGYDIHIEEQFYMDELYNSIFGNMDQCKLLHGDPVNINQLALSFANLPPPSHQLDSMSKKANIKEKSLNISLQPRGRADNITPQTSIGVVPLKKRPLPSFLNQTPSFEIHDQSIAYANVKGSCSLNELQLKRISTLQAAREKELKFVSPHERKSKSEMSTYMFTCITQNVVPEQTELASVSTEDFNEGRDVYSDQVLCD